MQKNKKEYYINYNNLSVADKKIIDQIVFLLKKLSEKGRAYWTTYYG